VIPVTLIGIVFIIFCALIGGNITVRYWSSQWRDVNTAIVCTPKKMDILMVNRDTIAVAVKKVLWRLTAG
jgi:hypothetical protein